MSLAMGSLASAVTAGTDAQVAHDVAASTSIHVLPANLTPTLTKVATSTESYDASGVSLFRPCDPYYHPSQVEHPIACFFGDVHATTTIALVGDSNVGNWLPALSAGLAKDKIRLAVVSFEGCPTPDLLYSATTGTSHYRDCNIWHTTMPAAVRATHPEAVLVSSGAVDLGLFTNAQWIAGMAKLFALITSSSQVRVLMGTSPMFPQSVPACLASYSDVQKCRITYQVGSGYYGEFVARDPQIASAARAHLVVTWPWMCVPGTCSPVVSHYLVYVDIDHLSISYSQYLATVVTSAVMKVVRGG